MTKAAKTPKTAPTSPPAATKGNAAPTSEDYEVLEGETCPICQAPKLTLMEATRDVAYFGIVHLFSMDCGACNFHKADVEAEESHGAVQYTFTCESEEDLKVRVIKSSNATIKLGVLGSIDPGETSNGYVTNIEGILNRFKNQVEHLKRAAEEGDERDEEALEQAKKHLKKLTRILWGQEPLKIVIKDPTGNSAILSDKAERKKL